MDIAMDTIYHYYVIPIIPTYLSFYILVAFEWTDKNLLYLSYPIATNLCHCQSTYIMAVSVKQRLLGACAVDKLFLLIP